MVKHTVEVVDTHEQTPYEGSIGDRLRILQELANRFNSNVRLWESYPVDDGQGCVDFEVSIIHEVTPKKI